MSETIKKILTMTFLGFIAMGVLLHAKQFSQAAGTIDTGINATGRVLEGR